MRIIFRQIVVTLIAVAAVYALLLIGALFLYPLPDPHKAIDSAHAVDTVFTTDAKYVFLNRAALRSSGPEVILLGASNTQVGFRTDELRRLLGGMAVHNLSVGASNVTQDRQVFELVREMASPDQLRQAVFVIGIWYGNTIPDATVWSTPDRVAGDTNIDIERYRYGLAWRTASGPHEVVPPSLFHAGLVAIYPFVAVDRLARDLTLSLRQSSGQVELENRTEAERNTSVMTNQQKADALAYWRSQVGKPQLGAQQFDVLEKTVDEIRAARSKVLVVNLPIPRWHSDASSYEAEYNQRWTAFAARMAGKLGVKLLDMRDLNGDTLFSDEIHPRPNTNGIWDRRLAAALTTSF